jgi:5,5'-dehydrodivanillate O-demethylase
VNHIQEDSMVSTNGRSHTADWTDFVHTGPGTLAGRYLRSFWQPVARSQDLVAGRPQRVRIMSEDFTLYRGESNKAHLLEARCPHRGTYLSTGWVENDDIRCFYHGWKFDSTGQCVEQPAKDADFCRKIRIRSYPVEEYLGLVFAYLGEGEPPEMYRFPTWEAPDAGVRNAYPMVWPCNYFQFLENGVDHVHGSFVHGPRTASYGLPDVPVISGHETEYGIIQIGTRKRHRRIGHLVMPNSVYNTAWNAPNGNGGPPVRLWFVPLDDEHYWTFNITLLGTKAADRFADQIGPEKDWERQEYENSVDIAERVLRGEMMMDDLGPEGRARRGNSEDYVAIVGQGPFVDRSKEKEHLGRSDVLIILLRKIWQRELQALAEGRPLKQWRLEHPEQLEVSAVLEEALQPA